MKKIFYIGGSPCSGKSTVAEKITDSFDFYYYKVDDYLERFTQTGAKCGYKICKKQAEMLPEQIWMRNPKLQCEEELRFYHEIFDLILLSINQVETDKCIITEGAAFLPELMDKISVSINNYISITPTKSFQIEHYEQREWITYVLEDCSDKKKAFENWMDRDALFAVEVRNQCANLGYKSIITDNNVEFDHTYQLVCRQFGLEC